MSDYQVKLLTTNGLLDVPEPKWLIEDHVHQEEVGVIYGAPNGGKTFVALDWALSVAAGVPWLGQFPTLQGPVLYMAGEGAASLQKRVEAWMVHNDVAELPAYFQCRPLPLIEEQVVEDIRTALAELQLDDDEPGVSPTLIVVDTLSQFMMGGDENGTDMALFVARLRHLSQEESCAVLIVHHTNKGGISERGHTALRGNVDIMFKVSSKETDGQLAGIELMNDKQRDNPRAKPVTLTPKVCQQSLVFLPENAVVVPKYVLALDDESLKDLLMVSVTVEDTDLDVVSKSDWLLASGLLNRTFYRKVHILLDLKLIRAAGNGKYKLTPKGRDTVLYYRRLVSKEKNDTPRVVSSTGVTIVPPKNTETQVGDTEK